MGTNAHSRISATVVNVLFAQSDPNRKGGGKKLQYREPVPPSAVKQGGERGERERERKASGNVRRALTVRGWGRAAAAGEGKQQRKKGGKRKKATKSCRQLKRRRNTKKRRTKGEGAEWKGSMKRWREASIRRCRAGARIQRFTHTHTGTGTKTKTGEKRVPKENKTSTQVERGQCNSKKEKQKT